MENDPNFVSFGDVCRQRMGQQCQYGSRYFCLNWKNEYTYLGEGLRITGDSSFYHGMMIHKDDVETAVQRYLDHHRQS